MSNNKQSSVEWLEFVPYEEELAFPKKSIEIIKRK